MRQKSIGTKDPAERAIRDIRRKTRKQYSAEEKIRIVVSGLRGEESILALCRHEGIAEGLYYGWSNAPIYRSGGRWTSWASRAPRSTGGTTAIRLLVRRP